MDKNKSRKIKKTSRFAIIARRAGGLSREKALARADGSIEKLEAKYLGWVARDLLILEGQVNAIHQVEGTNDEDMEAAYIKAAEIRDLGATFDFPLTTEVADGLCELLHRFRHAGMYGHAALQTHLAALQLVCTEAFKGKKAAEEKPLLDGLRRVLEKYPPVESDAEAALRDDE
jgi:hypothetical protein